MATQAGLRDERRHVHVGAEHVGRASLNEDVDQNRDVLVRSQIQDPARVLTITALRASNTIKVVTEFTPASRMAVCML